MFNSHHKVQCDYIIIIISSSIVSIINSSSSSSSPIITIKPQSLSLLLTPPPSSLSSTRCHGTSDTLGLNLTASEIQSASCSATYGSDAHFHFMASGRQYYGRLKSSKTYRYLASSYSGRVYCLLTEAARKQLALGYYAACLLYTSPSPRDGLLSRMPSSA